MKNLQFRIVIYVLFLSLLLASCDPAQPAQPTPTKIVETEVIAPVATATEEEPEIDVRFSIQAEDDLTEIVSILYETFFSGETPMFVDDGADLIVTYEQEIMDNRPTIQATFLPGSVMLPQSENIDLRDFIAFSISPDGQQVLIDAGELPQTVILTDQDGRTVEIIQPIRTVISTYGPATAFIYSVGAGSRLVSASYLGARDPFGASVMEKIDPRFPVIMGDDNFSQQNFNVEEAASLSPDLIVAGARSVWLDTVELLDISVFQIDAETPERLKEAMLLTGQLFGPHTYAQARAWVAYYDHVVDAIQEQTGSIPLDEQVRVLFTGTEPLRVASGEMYQTYIIQAAGAISVTSDLAGYWNNINLEQVVIWDPDVIIVPPYGGASVGAITESAEWQILTAVENGRVYRMPKLVVPWDTPSADSVLGIIWMAQQLNPDFVELDCALEAEYFYNTYYNYKIEAEEIALICSFD